MESRNNYSQREEEDSERHYNSGLLQLPKLAQVDFAKELHKKATEYTEKINKRQTAKRFRYFLALYH